MSEWQDISTAPSEGYFLAYTPTPNGNRIKIVRRFGILGRNGFKPQNSNSVMITTPTHWMPLPEEPNTEKK